MAYYPTDVPFHHRSQWLGNTDPFGDLVAGCRKLGMVVIARTDPHATYDDVQQAHWVPPFIRGLDIALSDRCHRLQRKMERWSSAHPVDYGLGAARSGT